MEYGPSAACECTAEDPSVDHVALECPIYRPLHGLHDLTVPDDETIEWLLNTCDLVRPSSGLKNWLKLCDDSELHTSVFN